MVELVLGVTKMVAVGLSLLEGPCDPPERRGKP